MFDGTWKLPSVSSGIRNRFRIQRGDSVRGNDERPDFKFLERENRLLGFVKVPRPSVLPLLSLSKQGYAVLGDSRDPMQKDSQFRMGMPGLHRFPAVWSSLIAEGNPFPLNLVHNNSRVMGIRLLMLDMLKDVTVSGRKLTNERRRFI